MRISIATAFLGAAITSANIAIFVDTVHGHKEALKEGVSPAAHIYAAQGYRDLISASESAAGFPGLLAAYSATTVVGMVSLPGILIGDAVGKKLYEPK